MGVLIKYSMADKINQPGAAGMDDVEMSTDGAKTFAYNVAGVTVAVGTAAIGYELYTRVKQALTDEAPTDGDNPFN